MLIRILIIGYIFLGFFPKYIVADWKVAHLSYLSALNILTFIYFFFKDNLKIQFKTLKAEHILYFLFFLWGILTLYKSINKVESVMILTEIFTQLFSFISIYFLIGQLKKNAVKLIFVSLAITLFLEVGLILQEYFSNFKFHLTSGRNNIAFRGITGNINIAAFSILIKIPVLYYLYVKSKSFLSRTILYLLITLSIFVIISVISSRASLVALGFITSLFIFIIYFRRKLFHKFFFRIILFALIPLILNISINVLIYKSLGQQTGKSLIDRVESLNLGDTSSSQRLRYYSHAIDTFLENPIFGIGIGGWELESIKRDSKNIENYTVPYHVHNDYLEILAETGLLGFIIYFGIFFVISYRLLLFLFKNKNKPDHDLLIISILLCLIIFFIDSFFNFPFARTLIMNQVFILVSLALVALNSSSFEVKNPFKNVYNKIKRPTLKILYFIVLILIIPILYSQFRVSKSYNDQAYLIGEFNANALNRSVDYANKMEVEYPNLSATAMPLGFFKGVIYAKTPGKESEAIEIFRKHKKVNPYNYFGETQIGDLYYRLGVLDSAKLYTKKAFYGIPNNMIHYANYLKVLTRLGDTTEIKEIRNKIKLDDSLIDEMYVLAMAGLLDKDEGKEVLRSAEKISYNFDDKNAMTRASIYVLNLGKEKALQAHKIFSEGLTLFDNGKYKEALSKFKESHEMNPLERAYAYNTANAYIRIGDDDSAIIYLDKIINNIDPTHGSSFYLRGLIYYDLDNKIQGCSDLRNAVKLGFRPAEAILKRFCF